MSDKGEKTCPLCAEEMDLTDQQLKPCKCGYEICVWCWHHIMEMAEKDGTDGRCPACRFPYDKERIVGMTTNCERLVAEINVEKKKSQKSKSKSSEGRKQLINMRVIQRNLVYIMGLPLHLGDEDLLHHREYFGQYGRVLKVSMSRTAAGIIQQFPNNTCSVYITYSKEEEAVRCIQSVHGYTLEGRPLRACFGTTKYCHAWVRNVPCCNPDCLYLHEIGSQEDSFTKDEIISAYTRNRVEQIIDPASSQQRRSGDVLPPPLDDYDSSFPASKPIIKNASSHVTTSNRDSPLNGSSDRYVGLPAAASWATRASSSQPPAASLVSSNGLLKQKSDTGDSRVISSATASIAQTSSSNSYAPKKPNEENQSIQSMPSNSLEQFGKSSGPNPEDVRSVYADGHMANLCSDKSVMSINKNTTSGSSGPVGTDYSLGEYGMTSSLENQGLQQSMLERCKESLASSAVRKASSPNGMYISSNHCEWTSHSQNQASKISPELEEDVLCFDNQRLNDPEVISRRSSKSSVADHSGSHSLQKSGGPCAPSLVSYPLSVDDRYSDISSLHEFSSKLVLNGTPESLDQRAGIGSTIDHILVQKNDGKEYMGMQQRDAVINNIDVSFSSGENSIISDILSMDFDPWDESPSPQVLAKLLRDSDGRNSLNRISKSLKVQNNTQSRFSFARQEESVSQPFDVEPPHNISGQISESRTFSPFSQNRDSFMDNFGHVNGLSSNSVGEHSNGWNSQNAVFPNKVSASRFPVSAPPGFSVPSRLPPPGFSQERVEQAFSLTSGNHLLDTSALLRNSYQAPKSGNIGSPGEIFTDHANMDVFKGRPNSGPDNLGFDMRSAYAQRFNTLDDEARLKLLLQRSISQHRNLGSSDIGNNYSLLNDSYGVNSRVTDQPQVNNPSPFAQLSVQQPRNSLMSNGQWDGWNEISDGNGLGMAGQLRNERLGFNKFYSGYEDSKFHTSSSGDLYNRRFGM